MRYLRPAVLVLLFLAAGCGAPEVHPEEGGEAPQTEGKLVVRALSLVHQRPIGVIAEVLDLSTEAVRTVDTTAEPEVGSTLVLPAGSYRIVVRQCVGAGGRLVQARGEEVVYVEPGMTKDPGIVVDDRTGKNG